MRRFSLFGGLLAVAVLASFSIGAARVSKTGDGIVKQQQAEDNVAVIWEAPAALTTATTVQLVDLSDNVAFRHVPTTGGIDVSEIDTWITTDDVASGTIKFGIVATTTPDGSLGSVAWFHTAEFSGAANGATVDTFNPGNSVLKGKVNYTQGSVATTTGFVTNDVTNNSTAFTTSTAYLSPRGTGAAGTGYLGVGDLVMYLERFSGLGRGVDLRTRVIYNVAE